MDMGAAPGVVDPVVAAFPREQAALRARCFHPGGNFVPFAKSAIERSIVDRFEQQVRRYPDHLALKTRKHLLTYAEVNRQANRIAQALLALRRAVPEPAGLLFENGAPFVMASLGVLKAGKIHLVLDSTFPRTRLTYMLEQSGAGVVVTDDANEPLAKQLTGLPLINIDRLGDGWSDENPGLHPAPDAVAAVGYTSGSTGRPKGIAWCHRSVLHATLRHTNMYRICAQDRLMMFRASLRASLYALLNGAAFYPVNLRNEEPAEVAQWLAHERITVYRAAVSVFRSLTTALTGSEVFPQLRLILLFGEPTYQADIALYRKHFPDECLLASSLGCNEFDDYAYFFVGKDTSLDSGVVPGGYPIADAEVLILDDERRPMSPGQTGEIALRSRYNAVGYWRRPDLTDAAFIPVSGADNDRIYLTGDMGCIAPDGCISHLGRKDFQVKIRGHRVEVAEVESALLELNYFKQAAVVGHDFASGEKYLVAYLVPHGARMPLVSEVRGMLAEKLPGFMIPSSFVTVSNLPLTDTGKVDRRALGAPPRGRPALETPFVAPRTALEEWLAGVWAEVLGIDQVGVDDNFLELGGDSLMAMRVISRVFAQTGTRVTLGDFFSTPTLAGIARIIAPV